MGSPLGSNRIAYAPSSCSASGPPPDSYDRLLLALEQLLAEVQRAVGAGVREWASLAMLDAIGFAEELGMMRDDDAERRRAVVREAFGDVDQGWARARVAWSRVSN